MSKGGFPTAGLQQIGHFIVDSLAGVGRRRSSKQVNGQALNSHQQQQRQESVSVESSPKPKNKVKSILKRGRAIKYQSTSSSACSSPATVAVAAASASAAAASSSAASAASTSSSVPRKEPASVQRQRQRRPVNDLLDRFDRVDVKLLQLRRRSYSTSDVRLYDSRLPILGTATDPNRPPNRSRLARCKLRRAFTIATDWTYRPHLKKSPPVKMGQSIQSQADHRSHATVSDASVSPTFGPLDEVGQLREELTSTKRQLYEKEQELLQCHREIHKLRCVLDQTHGGGLTAATAGIIGQPLKKCGVSSECFSSASLLRSMDISKVPKDFHSRQLIKDALLDNSFLKHFLDQQQLRLIVDAMYEKEFAKGQFICIQGQFGSHLYVIAYGHCEIIANDYQLVNQLGTGKAFGELAILYNCARTASVKALTKVRTWVLDRKAFQMIMMKTGKDKQSQYRNFLKSVPLLKNLSEDLIAKIVDAIEVDYYPSGQYICRQGCTGESFYIISSGSVKVTQTRSHDQEEQTLRVLEVGEYFGEQALLGPVSLRTANVISLECECLVLDRTSFHSLIGELTELKSKHYEDTSRRSAGADGSSLVKRDDFQELVDVSVKELRLEDLETVVTLGVGGFGRVDLVRARAQNAQEAKIFALKSCLKKFIRSTQQEEHVNNERIVQWLASKHQFVVRLWRTFRDQSSVYFLMEASLGGELWTLLRHRGAFQELEARFYVGCVVEALQFLHSKSIIYRDLKPENCLLDVQGYLKLTDFGFSKILGPGDKTWTFCGTPEYVAPEVILNRGHDYSVDFWSLGIFLYELITGMPPFASSDPLKTYNIILRGFDAIGFDEHLFSKNSVNLIRRLCRENPSERIGVQKNGIDDLKRHKWFNGFDFDRLVKRAIRPPVVPKLSGPVDTRYFDVCPDPGNGHGEDQQVEEDGDETDDEEAYDPNWDVHF